MTSQTLTKAILAQHLEEQVGLDAELALSFVEHFFEEIIIALENSEEVKLSGLGKFSVRKKSSRPGRNPKTKQAIQISSRRVATFKMSPTLKAQFAEIDKQKAANNKK